MVMTRTLRIMKKIHSVLKAAIPSNLNQLNLNQLTLKNLLKKMEVIARKLLATYPNFLCVQMCVKIART